MITASTLIYSLQIQLSSSKYTLKSRLFLTIESGNPPSSIRSALKEHCSSSLSLASFCFAALCASDLKLSNFKEKGKDHGAEIKL